jgi:hypothetical protein
MYWDGLGIKVASVQEVAAAYASVAARWDSLTLIVSRSSDMRHEKDKSCMEDAHVGRIWYCRTIVGCLSPILGRRPCQTRAHVGYVHPRKYELPTCHLVQH